MADFNGLIETIAPSGSAELVITAPQDEMVRIECITLNKAGDQDCNLGVIEDTRSGDAETKAIRHGSGGEVKGPWLINDTHGIIIENRSSNKVTCSYMGRVEG
jgi:hypothetical protein